MKKSNRVVSFLLALTLVTGLMPADAFTFTAYATAQDGKPADGTLANGEVFPTGVSENFRIPGLVNFQGNLIASADARWNDEKDGGGMDLVVSRSSDGGATWNYTFAGYLGDNGNEYNANSTTLMDPVIITDGETLYLVADMFPAGYSISSSSTAKVFSDTNIGFDAKGSLLLSDDGRNSYGYYLSGNKIYQTDGTVVSGYTVDGWFNLYNADEYVTNLFFADSPYQVRATSYICMMSSNDGGKTWSDPTLLNVKPQGVSWMVLGPGSGLVTKDGYIAFTAYDNTNIYLIYGKDGEWNTVKTSAATNESSIIELNDGTIRAFVKHNNNTISYIDFTWNGSAYEAGSLVSTGQTNCSSCMISSLHYSRTYGEQEVVLVCCPSTSGTRTNGKIYAFILDDNNDMSLLGSYQLNNAFFAYSNMAEMDDGTIALLYEDDCNYYEAINYDGTRSHITFTTVDLEEVLGKTFDAVTLTDDNTDISVTAPDLSHMEIIKLAESQPVPGFSRSATYSIKLYDSKGQLYSGRAKVQIPVTDGLGDCERYIGSVDGELFEVEAPVDGFFTVTVPHFSDVTISGYKAGDPATVNVKLYKGFSKTVLLDGFSIASGTIVDSSIASMTVMDNSVPGSTDSTAQLGTDSSYAGDVIPLADCLYTFTENGGSFVIKSKSVDGVYLNLTGTAGYPQTNSSALIQVTNGTTTGTFYLIGDNGAGKDGYLWFWRDGKARFDRNSSGATSCDICLYRPATPSDVSSTEIPGYVQVTELASVTAGEYLIAAEYNGEYYVLHPSTSTSNYFAHVAKVTGETVTQPGDYETEVHFEGLSLGTTTATVGHVTFNIEVLDVSSAVDGDIAGFTQIVGTKTYSDANGSVALSGKPITKLTIAAGSTFASLGVDIANADAVIWSSEDTGVATVDQNGSVTAVAEGETNISAKVIKDGIAETISIPVRVIPSLIPADNTAALDESLSYVEAAHYVDVYFSLYGDDYAQELKQVQTGEVVYFTRPINVAYGMVWMSAPQDAEKYALAYMAATGTEGQYYPLLPAGHDASEKCFCGSTAYKNLLNSYGATEDELNSMLAAALAAHCTGAMSQGRTNNKGVSEPMVTSLTFAAEKLPDVSKTLNGILPGGGKAPTFRRYTGERMTGEVGDYIYFTIAVTQEAPKVFDPARTDGNYSLVEYTQATLIDNVEQGEGDYYFYTKAQDINYDGVIDENDGSGYQQLTQIEIQDDLNTAWTAQEIAAGKRTKEYYVVYKIVEDDLQLVLDSNGEPEDQIKNSVTFNYSFNSIYDYSKGSTAGAAAAAAETLVVGEYVGEFVVDFGLPLIITVTGAQGGFQYLRKENYVSCKYGTVEVTQTKGADTTTDFEDDEFTIVYTPTTILPTADEVLLFRTKSDTDEDIVVNSFSVVPASSVYYAAGLKEKAESTKPLFFEKTNGWSWESLVVGPVQNLDTLGDVDTEGKPIKTNPYGYDAVYATMSGLSHGTQLSAAAKGAEAVFSFTGTGMEIFANCSATTGTVTVEIWTFDDNGDAVDDSELVWAYLVDTKADATYYGLPIVSVTDLEYDSYVVKLCKTQNDGTVNIDGFRILGTVEEDAGDSSLYFYDQEDHPDFYELRDFVLGGMGVQGLDNWRNWYSAVTGNQIFNQGAYASGAIVLDAASTQLGMDAETLLKYGPKNELFLWKGQSLTFKVTTDRLMQIGLKAPQGPADVQIKLDGNELDITSINTSVDMFYELNSKPATETTYTITITNNGTNVLSVTKLKICDDPDATFGTLTEEDVANVLVDQGLMPQRTDKDATVRVSLRDYAGNQVGAVTLSKRGADGRRVTFTAAEVLAAARQQMPEGYDFVNKEAVFDVTATYGESREAYVQVGKVATVNITYISLSKRKVYTITVTKIQFAEGDCQLSVTELMHYSPLGRFLLMMSGITAEYGAETDVVVTVL